MKCFNNAPMPLVRYIHVFPADQLSYDFPDYPPVSSSMAWWKTTIYSCKFSSGIFQQIMFDYQRVKNDGSTLARALTSKPILVTQHLLKAGEYKYMYKYMYTWLYMCMCIYIHIIHTFILYSHPGVDGICTSKNKTIHNSESAIEIVIFYLLQDEYAYYIYTIYLWYI